MWFSKLTIGLCLLAFIGISNGLQCYQCQDNDKCTEGKSSELSTQECGSALNNVNIAQISNDASSQADAESVVKNVENPVDNADFLRRNWKTTCVTASLKSNGQNITYRGCVGYVSGRSPCKYLPILTQKLYQCDSCDEDLCNFTSSSNSLVISNLLLGLFIGIIVIFTDFL